MSVYFLTLKLGSGLTRLEFENRISKKEYENLENDNLTKFTILKTRHIIFYNEHTYYLDYYNNVFENNKNLITVEVEFHSEEEAKNFTPPDWLGEEITNDEKYKNKNLKEVLD